MGDERILKSLVYSESVDGRRKRVGSKLRFKDVCKCDLKSLNVGTDKWEELANDRDKWRSSVYRSLQEREKQFFKKPKLNESYLLFVLFFFCVTVFVLL